MGCFNGRGSAVLVETLQRGMGGLSAPRFNGRGSAVLVETA